MPAATGLALYVSLEILVPLHVSDAGLHSKCTGSYNDLKHSST